MSGFSPLLHRAIWPVNRLFLSDRLQLLEDKKSLYERVQDPEQIRAYQLAQANEAWCRAVAGYDFYKDWKKRHGLPDYLSSLEELAQFPLLTKPELQAWKESIYRDAGDCDTLRSGGSTGEPTAVPCNAHDRDVIWANLYLGRSWWGITPADRKIMIWGKAYSLDESPIKRLTAGGRRQAKDFLMNSHRLSAFHLSPQTAEDYFRVICANRGAILVSYASAFKNILDWIERNNVDGRAAGLDYVILSAESIDPHDVVRAKELMGARLISEYGMSETGCIGYGYKESLAHRVFWDTVIAQADAEGELSVTTIADNLFPLIRYNTGDRIELADDERRDSLLRFGHVIGRVNDNIDIPLLGGGSAPAHCLVVEHMVRRHREVSSYHVRQKGRQIEFLLMMPDDKHPEDYREPFLSYLRSLFPQVDGADILFSRLDQEIKTARGKRRVIVRVD